MIKIYQKSSSNQSAERVTSWFKKRNIPYVVISKTSLCKEDIVRVLELSNKGFEEQFKKAYAQSNALYDFLMKNLDKIDLKEKAGNYILTIKDFKEILKKEFSALDPTGKGLDGFEDLILTFTVDKKTFLPVNFTMVGAVNEGGIKMNFSFDVKYSNINNVKEIVIPKEALEAKEINPLEEIEKINVENKKW